MLRLEPKTLKLLSWVFTTAPLVVPLKNLNISFEFRSFMMLRQIYKLQFENLKLL